MTTKMLHISPDLSLPLDVVTQSIGVVAQRGSGKSYLAAVLAEELIGAGLPVVVLDPVGVFWGLRSGASGKTEGLPVVILGGDHGDVPLEAGAGKVIADWIITERRPAVLDLSHFRKGEQRQFVTDLAEELYRKNREPLHLVLDEADLFGPQRPQPGEQRMLGAFEDLVRRGRARGIGLTLITQRPAVLHKDLLTQVSALVALRLVGPQDRRAVEDWISVHGDEAGRKEVLGSLASLPIGTAWFWSPGWLGILKRVRIRERMTFDSSKTPAPGARLKAPEKLAPVDLVALQGRIAATIERAKADDPKALRVRIAELERQIAAKPAATVERIEVPVMVNDPTVISALERGRLALTEALAAIADASRYAQSRPAPDGLRFPPGKWTPELVKAFNEAPPESIQPRAATPLREKDSRMHPQAAGAPPAKLPTGERAVLTAVAQHRDGVTREQLTVLTGYKRSSRDTYLQRLSASGLIQQRGDRFFASPAGMKALGSDFEPLPTGRALLEHWLEKLPDGERKVLDVVANAYPNGVHRIEIDERTGYKRSSRDTYLQRLGARRLVITERDGVVALSEELVG